MSNEKFEPIIRFVVMSDVHIKDVHSTERDRFRKGISDAYKIAQSSKNYKEVDAFVIVGDFATNGSEIQMQCAKEILNDELKQGTQVILSLASHEYSATNGGVEAAIEKLERIFSQKADVHKIINGFHFVSVSPSESCRFNEQKQSWVYENLEQAKKDDPKKPVFMFQHPHVTSTVYGSILWGEDDLIPAYMDHPQILVFSGHSHAPINDPRSVHQQHFTCFGTGTLSYFELDEFDKVCGTRPENGDQAAQMLVVEADAENRVRVYPYDILTGNFFPRVWSVDTPSDPETFIYTDEKRYKQATQPYFDEKAFVRAEDIASNSARLVFSQAIDDLEGYVNSYDLILRKKADNTIVAQQSIWSDYYLYNMPETCSFSLEKLEGQTQYAAKITAKGFFKNESSNHLSIEFKTK